MERAIKRSKMKAILKSEMKIMYFPKLLLIAGGALAGFLITGNASALPTLYGTSLETSRIVSINMNTSTVSTVASASSPDSLVFDSAGRIIYTALSAGEVRLYDPIAHTDTLVASGFNTPADLVMEPGGNSVLVSEFGGGKIDRINLTTHAVSPLGAYGGNPEGLAYDSSGRLFANLGVRDGLADKYIAQIDPATGAILKKSAGVSSLDGLTFDSSTGRLYAASLFDNGIYSVDPSTLSGATFLAWGALPMPDGITSDGAGNLFAASRSNFNIYRYDLTASTLTPGPYVYGLDDLAPASGLGSSPVPEPSTLLLLGSGLTGLVAMRRFRKQ